MCQAAHAKFTLIQLPQLAGYPLTLIGGRDSHDPRTKLFNETTHLLFNHCVG